MKIILSLALVLLIVASTQAFNIVQDTADDKVKIDFYF